LNISIVRVFQFSAKVQKMSFGRSQVTCLIPLSRTTGEFFPVIVGISHPEDWFYLPEDWFYLPEDRFYLPEDRLYLP